MKNTFLKVGVAIPAMKIGYPSYNAKQILELIQKNQDVSVLVFPELSLSGYTCQDLFFQDVLLDHCLEELIALANAVKDNTVLVGLPYRYKNKLYNCAAVLSQGEIKGLVPKSFIPNYSEFYEDRWFASGSDILDEEIVIDGKTVPFGTRILFKDEESGLILSTEICEDVWVVDRPSRTALLAGANVIANLSASDEKIGKRIYRRNLVKQVSAEGYCTYLYCSSGSDESSTDLVFSGHSMICDNGSLLKESFYPEQNTVLTAVIDLEKNQYNRLLQSTYHNDSESYFNTVAITAKNLGGNKDVTPEDLVSYLKKEDYPVERMPFVPALDNVRKERCQEILSIQAHGLATRVKNTGIKNLVIGISGGLDSTLALLVAYEVSKMVDGVKIYGFTMPNEGNTSGLTYSNSWKLMKCLNVIAKEVPINEGVKIHLRDIGHEDRYLGEGDTSYENAQARMRTYILMDVANMVSGLVVGTGDLSELALGWCTYNGDHMSMYAVNASVPKTLVRYMVETYAQTMADEELKEVLLSIAATPITPELTPSDHGQIAQKTEEKIGKYDLNDFFLYYFLRFGFAPAKIVALTLVAYPELSKAQIKESLARFYKRFFSQQFKRSCLPDGPKVGSITLSPRGDYRMPSDASCQMYLDELENA